MKAICIFSGNEPLLAQSLTEGKAYTILKEYDDGHIIEFLDDSGKKILRYKNEFLVMNKSMLTDEEYSFITMIMNSSKNIQLDFDKLTQGFSNYARAIAKSEYNSLSHSRIEQ